jgi:hypothetical protein
VDHAGRERSQCLHGGRLELRPAAVWPPESALSAVQRLDTGELDTGELPPFGAGARAVPVRHGDELHRLAAHGGTLDVRSEPGQGTTVSGRLPVVQEGAAIPVPAGA